MGRCPGLVQGVASGTDENVQLQEEVKPPSLGVRRPGAEASLVMYRPFSFPDPSHCRAGGSSTASGPV